MTSRRMFLGASAAFLAAPFALFRKRATMRKCWRCRNGKVEQVRMKDLRIGDMAAFEDCRTGGYVMNGDSQWWKINVASDGPNPRPNPTPERSDNYLVILSPK